VRFNREWYERQTRKSKLPLLLKVEKEGDGKRECDAELPIM